MHLPPISALFVVIPEGNLRLGAAYPSLNSHFLSSTSAALAGALLASIWQGLLLTLAVALCLRLLPGLSSAARSAIWTAVLLTVVALPALPLTFSHAAAPAPGLLHLEETVSFALVALWAVASLFRLLQLGASALRLRRILRDAQPVAAAQPVALILSQTRRPVTLCTSADIDRPSVAGFFRPRILFPPDLLAELNQDDLCHIVLHETEHLRRYDDWVNLLQQISLVLFPLSPALLWLNRRLSLERELACDDSVLQATRARKAYAACLARVAENSLLRRSAALVLGVLGNWARKPELASRVERILRNPAQSLSCTQMRFATAALVVGVLGFGGVLAHSPRLVGFVPASAALAQASPASYAAALPGLAPARMALPHASLVKAVMPAPRSASPLAPASLSHPRQAKATARRRTPFRAQAPWVVLTSWQSAPQPRRAVPVVRLTSVVVQDSQVWYTAVAVRDGWIVVQL